MSFFKKIGRAANNIAASPAGTLLMAAAVEAAKPLLSGKGIGATASVSPDLNNIQFDIGSNSGNQVTLLWQKPQVLNVQAAVVQPQQIPAQTVANQIAAAQQLVSPVDPQQEIAQATAAAVDQIQQAAAAAAAQIAAAAQNIPHQQPQAAPTNTPSQQPQPAKAGRKRRKAAKP